MSSGDVLDSGGAPYNGPYQETYKLIDAASAIDEGAWVRTKNFANASLEATVASGTFSAQLYGSNSDDAPHNQMIATIGGSSVTTGDIVTLNITLQQLKLPPGQVIPPTPPPGPVTVSVPYTTVGGDTTTTIATALKNAINTNATLINMGITATSSGAAVTVDAPNEQGHMAVTGTLSGGATETVTMTTSITGSALGSAIVAAGITPLTTPVRWTKARLTAVSAGPMNLTYLGVVI